MNGISKKNKIVDLFKPKKGFHLLSGKVFINLLPRRNSKRKKNPDRKCTKNGKLLKLV